MIAILNSRGCRRRVASSSGSVVVFVSGSLAVGATELVSSSDMQASRHKDSGDNTGLLGVGIDIGVVTKVTVITAMRIYRYTVYWYTTYCLLNILTNTFYIILYFACILYYIL